MNIDKKQLVLKLVNVIEIVRIEINERTLREELHLIEVTRELSDFVKKEIYYDDIATTSHGSLSGGWLDMDDAKTIKEMENE